MRGRWLGERKLYSRDLQGDALTRVFYMMDSNGNYEASMQSKSNGPYKLSAGVC